MKNKSENWSHLPPYEVEKYADSYCFQTADIALMSIIDGELGVLLIRRADEPFAGDWALPGGFMQNDDEDVAATARRELEEETGLKGIHLEQLACFSRKGRDPREFVATKPVRIISEAFLALVDYTKIQAIAGSDASDTKWFKLSDLPTLSFDHSEIIETAVNRIRNKVSYTNVGFELVPSQFTIPEIREVFEKILGRDINPANFRTKILKLKILKKTKQKRIQGKGQPAPVYTLDRERFRRLRQGETLFN
jgi:8-oxo-dGTP diphosphatase